MDMLDDISDESLPSDAEPKFSGYQLIGDSQFLRFSESMLGLTRQESRGVYHLGFCVSGQKISDLLRRVQDGFAAVSEKVVLMIGTNDLLRGTSFEAMRDDFDSLLELLCDEAEKIILLTIPPVLKLKNDQDHWNRLKKYNDHIKQLKDGKQIFVGDAYAEFIVPKEERKRQSSISSLNSADPSRSHESPGPRDRNFILTNETNGDKMCHRVFPSSTNSLDEFASPSKRMRSALPSQPADQRARNDEKRSLRRPSSFDPRSLEPSPKRPRRMMQLSQFFLRSTSDILPLSGGPQRKHSSPPFPPTPPDHRDSFPSRRTPTPWDKFNRYHCPTTPSGSDDIFSNFARGMLPLNGEYNSPYTPRSSPYGSDDFSTARMRGMPYERRSMPAVFFGGDVNSSTPSPMVSPRKRSHSFSRAGENHQDAYGRSVEDDVYIENADQIRAEFFEEYFAGDTRRPDFIHLNARGLCAIRGLVQGIINDIDRSFM